MMQRLFSMSDATVLGDLEGAADHLRSLDGVTGRIGCIGFCMGGRYTLLFAVRVRPPQRRRRLLGRLHRPRDARRALHAAAPDAAAGARRQAQLSAAGGHRRRGPQPLARARRAAARARRRERPGGQSRRLRGRRPRLLRRLPAQLPPRAGRQAVGEVLPFLHEHLQAGLSARARQPPSRGRSARTARNAFI